ncbi:hypothetical protein OB2597_04460 [Pseudooceanicola batsensis HTCC2597]|uniref:Uncharacterized protein n=2 Tax=Pseudooceanicola batsensis TaxID=314255 RepID=A3U3M4_PSEBH|nr:hypothetical protein OB2597_04460 [Pseudooceanicola batsensis HTCC2597]
MKNFLRAVGVFAGLALGGPAVAATTAFDSYGTDEPTGRLAGLTIGHLDYQAGIVFSAQNTGKVSSIDAYFWSSPGAADLELTFYEWTGSEFGSQLGTATRNVTEDQTYNFAFSDVDVTAGQSYAIIGRSLSLIVWEMTSASDGLLYLVSDFSGPMKPISDPRAVYLRVNLGDPGFEDGGVSGQVPLPAGAVLMLSALGGLGVSRLRARRS